MISGTGMRPGDIVTASNGKTIEVLFGLFSVNIWGFICFERVHAQYLFTLTCDCSSVLALKKVTQLIERQKCLLIVVWLFLVMTFIYNIINVHIYMTNKSSASFFDYVFKFWRHGSYNLSYACLFCVIIVYLAVLVYIWQMSHMPWLQKFCEPK